MKNILLLFSLTQVLLIECSFAQLPGEEISKVSKAKLKDSLYIFKPIAPLIDSVANLNAINSAKFSLDVLFSGSGLGFGATYSKQFGNKFGGFISLGISGFRNKDEFEQWVVDPIQNAYVLKVPNKINRLYNIPLTLGIKYRLLSEGVLDNVFPYLNSGVGPGLVINVPYEDTFFSDLPYTKMNFTFSGFIGLGADIGNVNNPTIGVNLKYYFIPIKPSIESIINEPINDLGGFVITMNIIL